LGIRLACIISAVAFGIYHWFSDEVFGDPIKMILIFITTGILGLMFAYAFASTKSLYLPIGLHFGWNLVTIVVFSQGPLGQQLLTITNGQRLPSVLSILFFLFQVLALPLFTYWYVRRQRTATTNKKFVPV
jgi:membrane protease YdiL (CAAX protease family)